MSLKTRMESSQTRHLIMDQIKIIAISKINSLEKILIATQIPTSRALT